MTAVVECPSNNPYHWSLRLPALVAELVDALDSGSSEHCARGGSSPLQGTPILVLKQP